MVPMDQKKIILCADDFGLSPGICQGILKLVQMQRLSAVSCMVNNDHFPSYAQELQALHQQVQIGLHFNLTEGSLLSKPAQSCFGLNELLIKTHLGLLRPSFIEHEFNAQLDRYLQIMGVLPDFIDGHQHVHQFPQIRSIILKIYKQRLSDKTRYIRSTYPALTLAEYQLKGSILAYSGGKNLHAALKKKNIPHNSHFTGVYDFANNTDYRSLFNRWLSLVSGPTLMMCHPGEGQLAGDPIADTRIIEMNYFSSDDFLADCCAHQVQLAR